MPTITALVTEVQARANALDGSSTIDEVIETAIAARKVELAGGVITRTTLDTQINRIIADFDGSSLIEDMIAMAAGISVTQSSGKTMKVSKFTSSGTWTRPAGVDAVDVFLVGGGGGSGGLYDSRPDPSPFYYGAVGGSGGGGGVVKACVSVTGTTVGSGISVSIGAGGTAGSSSGGHGGQGGNTTFGSLATAYGGGGGGGCADGAYGVGSGNTNLGGSSITYTRDSTPIIAYPGLGAGAGGNAVPAQGGAVIYISGTYSLRPVIQNFVAPTADGSNHLGTLAASSISTYTYAGGRPGPSLNGYGAGGGSVLDLPGQDGAGGKFGKNAAANSGGGGGGRATEGHTFSEAGGTGGSGLAIVTWWE